MSFLSICIPSFNRSQYLRPLLESILCQDFDDFEIVICEDFSPEREEICRVVNDVQAEHRGVAIRLHLNEVNFGYDRNLRQLINLSCGEYCLFMGNDDLLASGALRKVAASLRRYPKVGVATRSYSYFYKDKAQPIDTVSYADDDRLFFAGPEAVEFFFRRVGVISGIVVHRESAKKVETSMFDGYLYYQMYLAGAILTFRDGYYFRDVITFNRDSEAPDFGNSDSESKVFVPGVYRPDSRVHMVKGMLKIAKHIEKDFNVPVYRRVKRDIAKYFYPYIRDQLELNFISYIDLVFRLAKLGFWSEPFFYIHACLAFSLKQKTYDSLVRHVRKRLGRSPNLGLYTGQSVK